MVGRTFKYHRAQVRRHLGFRECSTEDAAKLTEWLAAGVCRAERRADRVREELLARCRAERIEPPSAGRCDRIIRSALHQAEQALTQLVAAQLGPAGSVRLAQLAAATDDDAEETDSSALALIKSVPGNVSLESTLTEIGKLDAVRAAGLPDGVFAGIAPKVIAAWRARAAVEAPSHLRSHPEPLTLTLLAALIYERQREITDTLADLLISTVHRFGARAERKVTQELVSEFRKVAGKETLLFRLAEAAIARPDDTVCAVVYPVAGERTLRDLGDRGLGADPPPRHRGQPDLLPRRGAHPRARRDQRRLEAAGLPHRPARPPACRPDGIRDRHLPGAARAPALQGDLDHQRRPVAQPRRGPAHRLRGAPRRALCQPAQAAGPGGVHR
jgi:hypothetical protein